MRKRSGSLRVNSQRIGKERGGMVVSRKRH